MISLNFEQLARMTGGRLANAGNLAAIFHGVAIDSRAVETNQLFVAIRGEYNDGHKFIDQALANGAAGLISQQDNPDLSSIPASVPLITVEDSHVALMQLAENYRQDLSSKFIGITGSNGKTTTKEMTYQLAHALEPECYRSPGNLNNLYGLPLALFAMPADCRVAVMEMGISRPGEMTRLAQILSPDIIVITNIGPSHLQYLGSVEGVARAKLELVVAADISVPVIINGDDPLLLSEAKKLRSDLITFGLTEESNIHPDSFERGQQGLKVSIGGQKFLLPWAAEYQVLNLLAAYAACTALALDFGSIDTTLVKFETAPMRGERIIRQAVTFVADCYNANPDSVKASLSALAASRTEGRRVAILGDMLELGPESAKFHQEIGSHLAGLSIDLCIAVGEEASEIVKGAKASGMKSSQLISCPSVESAAKASLEFLKPNDLVLLKASRSVALERLLEFWSAEGGEV